MKFKKSRGYNPPLSHSNLTEQENLRSHYDPNGSWTGVPDGESDPPTYTEPIHRDVEAGDDKHAAPEWQPATHKPTEHITPHHSDDIEAGEDCPRDNREYPAHPHDCGEERYTQCTDEDDAWKDAEAAEDVYGDEDDASLPPKKPWTGSHDAEAGEDAWAFTQEGTNPANAFGYPSIPDGELPMDKAEIREDIVPVQDADDL